MTPTPARHGLIAALALIPVVSFADDFSWNSGSAANWTNTALWLPAGSTPLATDNLITPAQTGTMRLAGERTLANVDVNLTASSWTIQGAQGSSTIGGLTVTNDLSLSGSKTFFIGAGNSPSMYTNVGGNLSATGGSLVFNAATAKTITASVQGTTAANGGDISFGNNITDSRMTTVTLNGATTVASGSAIDLYSQNSSLNGVDVSGALGLLGTVALQGSSSLTLHGGSVLSVLGDAGDATVVTLDGLGTSGPLLVAEAGSALDLNFMTDGTNESLAIYNYAGASDFFLSGLTVDAATGTGLVGVVPGSYTLFSFYGDSGATPVASGLSGGLIAGTGFEGYYTSFDYSQAGKIVLTVSTSPVPEPSTYAALAGVIVLALAMRRRRQART